MRGRNCLKCLPSKAWLSGDGVGLSRTASPGLSFSCVAEV